MIQAKVHRQHNVGMVGGARNGTESIVLNGGYVDDQDLGDEVVFTGFGNRDSRGNQVASQKFWSPDAGTP